MLQSLSSIIIIYFYSNTSTSLTNIWTNNDYGNVRDHPSSAIGNTSNDYYILYYTHLQLNELKRFSCMLKKERYIQSYISVSKVMDPCSKSHRPIFLVIILTCILYNYVL